MDFNQRSGLFESTETACSLENTLQRSGNPSIIQDEWPVNLIHVCFKIGC